MLLVRTAVVNVSMMSPEKEQRVRAAALEVFLRHGYRKVTMDDIARGAGMSRPALYLVYPNKEAVFRDVVRSGLRAILREIERGLEGRHDLGGQLRHVLEVSLVAPFESVARAPAAGELLHASFDFVADVFEEFDQRLAKIVARLLRAAAREPGALRPSAEARARVLIAAARGFKLVAKEAADLRRLARDLVAMTVAAVPGPAATKRPRRS